MANNPFAVRFREAAFTLEESNIPEIAAMLHIASREIERLESDVERLKTALAASIAELEAALHEIADFSEQFIGDDEDGDERMYKVNQIADTTLALDRRDERLRAENEALKKEIEEMSYLTTRDDYEEMERKYSYAKQEAETNHYLAKKWEADLAAVRVELAECRISRQREHDLRVTIAGELESFKIRYQDEVNTRVNAENELDTVHSGFVAELRKAETAKLFVRQNFIADDEDGDKHE